MIRDWLHYCTKFHSKCSDITGNPVPNMMLVDCQTRQIVMAAPNASYAALSYVWGTCHSSHCGEPLDNLPEKLPSTIADAIKVTLALNLRYLWVDRYCIPQDNKEQKAEQTSYMHKIYERSQVAIIDALGSNPDHGLAGVSCARKLPQRVFQTGTRQFVDILPGPIEAIA